MPKPILTPKEQKQDKSRHSHSASKAVIFLRKNANDDQRTIFYRDIAAAVARLVEVNKLMTLIVTRDCVKIERHKGDKLPSECFKRD